MINDLIPDSVRYVKNGKSGQWWKAAQDNNQIHIGWKIIPRELLELPNFSKIEEIIRKYYGSKQGATQDFNALRWVLDAPSRHVWVTFEKGFMWWCTVVDGATPNPDGESAEKGHFWLTCNRPWSNKSLNGRLLSIDDLPGTVTKTAGVRGTICTPDAWRAILRIIQDEKDSDAIFAAKARDGYEQAILKMIKQLSWPDFEQLVDHILTRTGWARISTVGKTREGIDIAVENPALGERAFVQIKSAADQMVLNRYIKRFELERERYMRMIFAVHSPRSKLTTPPNLSVHVWTGDEIARLVVRTGLGEWVEGRLA